MILRCLWFSLFYLGLALQAHAGDAPEITLRGDDELGSFVQDGLVVQNLSVAIDIQSGLAQVSMTATLRNETDDQVEASFAYPLPEGAVINGYGLDIEGQVVDGVLMPKERAEALYTDRVTASVDPGIAARTADNRYRTRIYPIFENGGTRTLRLDFATPVPAEGLRLPFSQTKRIEAVSIQISGDGAAEAKTPIQGDTAQNTSLSGDIFIPASPAAASLSQYGGETFLTLPLAEPTDTQMTKVQSVAVIWDTSLSRDTKTLATERQFVGDVLAALNPETQSLIHGADRVNFAAPYGSANKLTAAIARLRYDGATDLSALINAAELSQADINPDICLLISDGRSNIGKRGLPNLPCRVFTYSAAKNINTDWLSLLASRNKGADLSALGAKDAASRIVRGGGIQLAPDQTGEIISISNRHWLITPIEEIKRRAEIKFQGNSRSVDLRSLSRSDHRGASSLWGQRRMTHLRAEGPSAFDAVVKVSRRYGVQGEETAFLVLETASDYIEAKIAPPRNFPAELMADYKSDLAEAQEDEQEEREIHLEDVLENWEDQIKWWETDWVKRAQKREERPQPLVEPSPPAPSANLTCWDGTPIFDAGQCPAEPVMEAPLQDVAPEEELDYIIVTASRRERTQDDEIIVMGSRRVNPAGEIPSEIKVTVRDWSPDRPFLKALEGLDGPAFETEYLRQRNEHGDRPSFYLEVADQLYRKGRLDRAAQMALTALDLPSATMITRSNIADRLLMYGETQRAISLYREILPSAQDRPQSHYNLALALIQAGDRADRKEKELYYREAFELLVHVINSPWEDDYEGIHLIALQDLNRTIARLPKRTRRKIQKDLGLHKVFFRNLPVDIRILVDWTSDDADLDIHVIERAGDEEYEEEAYYGNRATDIGGRISNDMTEGYGPEEYMIRRAPNGLYRVESDYYAQDAYAEDGALKLRARIWRDFGRPTESQDTVIIEMLEAQEDPYVLGEIQIGPVVAPAGETE